MDIEVVKIHVVCDDILQELGVVDDPQAQMTNAEVMSFAMIAGSLMHGNHQNIQPDHSATAFDNPCENARRLSDTAAERDHSFLHFTYLDTLRP
jgi:hypothetical protein